MQERTRSQNNSRRKENNFLSNGDFDIYIRGQRSKVPIKGQSNNPSPVRESEYGIRAVLHQARQNIDRPIIARRNALDQASQKLYNKNFSNLNPVQKRYFANNDLRDLFLSGGFRSKKKRAKRRMSKY